MMQCNAETYPPMGSMTPSIAFTGSSVCLPSASSAQSVGIFSPRRAARCTLLYMSCLCVHVQVMHEKGDVPSSSYAGRHVEDERDPSDSGRCSSCKGADAHQLVPAAPDSHLTVVSCAHPCYGQQRGLMYIQQG